VKKRVPTHFLGHDVSISESLWKIREFLNLTTEEQEREVRRWNTMKPREKCLYKTCVKSLIELQEKMMDDNGNTKQATCCQGCTCDGDGRDA